MLRAHDTLDTDLRQATSVALPVNNGNSVGPNDTFTPAFTSSLPRTNLQVNVKPKGVVQKISFIS